MNAATWLLTKGSGERHIPNSRGCCAWSDASLMLELQAMDHHCPPSHVGNARHVTGPSPQRSLAVTSMRGASSPSPERKRDSLRRSTHEECYAAAGEISQPPVRRTFRLRASPGVE